jgi:hypothetical protein
VYCGVATAINHEANSEKLYDTVVAAARENRETTEPADEQQTCKWLRGEGLAAAFWGTEAAAAALAAAAPAAAV